MGRPRKTPGDRVVERLAAGMDRAMDGGAWSWEPDEIERLELIRATANELDSLEQEWESERAAGRTMIRGSRNQDILHPLVAEIRAQRAQLDRLVGRMRVSQGSVAQAMSPSERGRHAANSRHNPSPAEIMAKTQERWEKMR